MNRIQLLSHRRVQLDLVRLLMVMFNFLLWYKWLCWWMTQRFVTKSSFPFVCWSASRRQSDVFWIKAGSKWRLWSLAVQWKNPVYYSAPVTVIRAEQIPWTHTHTDTHAPHRTVIKMCVSKGGGGGVGGGVNNNMWATAEWVARPQIVLAQGGGDKKNLKKKIVLGNN